MTEVTVWPGWLGGIAIGLYLLFQLLLTGRPLGVSSAYGHLCSLGSSLAYFARGEYAEPLRWRLWFLLGLPLGGGIAALTSETPNWVASFEMGPMYERVLPQALWARGAVLLLGGFLIGYGARLAGGCNSGHSIAGMSLLNPPSYAASAGFFLGGILMVQALFRLAG
jgi:uncharacterized membrane protein YedE/YeeE